MQAQEFYDTLTAEIVDNALGLDTAQNREAQRYYHTLVGKPQLIEKLIRSRTMTRSRWIAKPSKTCRKPPESINPRRAECTMFK
jgi:hypothetical protein